MEDEKVTTDEECFTEEELDALCNCPHNDAILCEGQQPLCGTCGYNPAVAERRKARLRFFGTKGAAT